MEVGRNPWQESTKVSPPVGAQLQVEVRNHTGDYKLPFPVIFKGGQLLNAVKQVPVDASLRVIRWRNA